MSSMSSCNINERELLSLIFWKNIRSTLHSFFIKSYDISKNDYDIFIGKKHGTLSQKFADKLNCIVDYYQGEGEQEILNLGIEITHSDDVIFGAQSVPSTREIDNILFNWYFKKFRRFDKRKIRNKKITSYLEQF